jgi:hypothetical protein
MLRDRSVSWEQIPRAASSPRNASPRDIPPKDAYAKRPPDHPQRTATFPCTHQRRPGKANARGEKRKARSYHSNANKGNGVTSERNGASKRYLKSMRKQRAMAFKTVRCTLSAWTSLDPNLNLILDVLRLSLNPSLVLGLDVLRVILVIFFALASLTQPTTTNKTYHSPSSPIAAALLFPRPFFFGLSSPSMSCFLAARLRGLFFGVSASSPVAFLRPPAFLGVAGAVAPSLPSLFLILAQALLAERGLPMPAKAASFS